MKEHPIDAWIMSAPVDNPYEQCPCGCEKKFRYIMKAGEEELEKHFQAFSQNMEKNNEG